MYGVCSFLFLSNALISLGVGYSILSIFVRYRSFEAMNGLVSSLFVEAIYLVLTGGAFDFMMLSNSLYAWSAYFLFGVEFWPTGCMFA